MFGSTSNTSLIPSNSESKAIAEASIYQQTPDGNSSTGNNQDLNEEEFVPKTSCLRWPLLFFFINCIMIVSALSLCLSPVTGKLAEAYLVPVVEVNMCGIIFTATYVPMTFVSMWMFKTFNTSTVLRFAILL